MASDDCMKEMTLTAASKDAVSALSLKGTFELILFIFPLIYQVT